MDIAVILDKMVMMLLMLAVGVVSAKAGLIDREMNRRLSNFAVAIPQCAIILSSAMELEMDVSVGKILGVMGAGCIMYVVLVALGVLVPIVARVDKRDRGLYSVLTVFANASFMGIPLVGAIFGSDAVFYVALLNIPYNLLVFTVGVRLMCGGKAGRFSWRQVFSPALVASLAAIVIIFLPIRWPAPVLDATAAIGDMILPLSMIIIGASLGEQKLLEVLLDWRVYLFAPVRLLAAPILVWAVLRLIIHDPVLLGTMTLIGGMPCAAISAMLSIQYGANEQKATRTVFLTTVLSAATIPLLCWLLLS